MVTKQIPFRRVSPSATEIMFTVIGDWCGELTYPEGIWSSIREAMWSVDAEQNLCIFLFFDKDGKKVFETKPEAILRWRRMIKYKTANAIILYDAECNH